MTTNFKQTDIGLIPEDWDIDTIDEWASVEYGKANPKTNGNVPLVGSGGIFGFVKEPLVNYSTIVIGRKGTAGSVQKFNYPNYPTDTTFFLKWKKNSPPLEMIYNWFLINPLSGLHAKTTIPSIQKPDVEKFQFPLPPLPEQKKIAHILSKIQQAIETQEQIVRTTQELKKALMQKLFTEGLNDEPQKQTEIGLIPESWGVVKLSDFCSVITDFVANGSFASLRENVKYKSAKDYAILLRLTDHSNKFQSDFVYVNQHAYEFLSKSTLVPGDVILSNVGARFGTTFRAPDLGIPMTLGPNAILLRAKSSDDFLYYWFLTEMAQKKIKEITSVSAQPKFNKTDLRNTFIPSPSLDEQNSISSNLLMIDQKIQIEEIKFDYLKQFFNTSLNQLMTGQIRT